MGALGVLVSFLLPAIAALGQSVTVTRVGSHAYSCVAVDGSYLSNHNTPHDAQERCSNEALKHPGKEYRVKSSDLSIIASASANPVITGGGQGGTSAPNVPSPPANTQAPTIPIMLSTVNGSGTTQFRFFEAVGPYDGSNAHPGVANYDADCGSGVLNGLVDGTTWPLTAANSNVQGDWTLNDIGTTSPDPTATRVNVVDWDIVGPGNPSGDGGFDASLTHEIAFLNRSVTSTQALSASLDTFTSPSSGSFPGEYDGAGIAIASSTASNAAIVAVVHTVSADNKAVMVHVRRTAGGARESSTLAASGDGSLHDLVLAPATCTGSGASTACTYSVYRVRSSSAELIYTTPSVTIGNAAIGGPVVFGLTSSAATARVSQLAIRTATVLTFSRTTVGSISCKVRSRATTSGSLSAWSNTITGSGAGGGGGSITWNPGHYVSDRIGSAFDGGSCGASCAYDETARREAICDLFEEIADEDNIQGVRVFYNIAQQFPTQGVYTTVLAAMDADIDCAEANGKQVLFWFRTGQYGTLSHPDITSDRFFPTWMRTGGYLRLSIPVSSGNPAVEIDYADLGSIWADLMTAMGEYCNTRSGCEGITPNWEIATGSDTFANQAAIDAYVDAIAANTVALKNAMPNKNVWAGASFPPAPSDAEEIVLAAAAVDAGYGDNDVQSNLITSVGYFTTYGHDAFFDNDLHNVVPFLAAIEGSELGDCSIGPTGGEAGPACGYYPADLINYLQVIAPTHIVWDKHGSSPDSGQNWPAILTAINADPVVNETCPSAYEGQCETP